MLSQVSRIIMGLIFLKRQKKFNISNAKVVLVWLVMRRKYWRWAGWRRATHMNSRIINQFKFMRLGILRVTNLLSICWIVSIMQLWGVLAVVVNLTMLLLLLGKILWRKLVIAINFRVRRWDNLNLGVKMEHLSQDWWKEAKLKDLGRLQRIRRIRASQKLFCSRKEGRPSKVERKISTLSLMMTIKGLCTTVTLTKVEASPRRTHLKGKIAKRG